MKPVLFASTETQFMTQGIGALSDVVTCMVSEERNGGFELEMQYPVEGKHFSELSLDRFIYAKPDPFRDPQPFRIYNMSKPIGGIVTINAWHLSYDLRGIPVEPFTARSAADAMNALGAKAVTQCPFSFWTDKPTSATMTVAVPTSIRSLMGGREGSVLDVYGGEYEYDHYKVKLHSARGTNRGVSIRYGKNLIDLTQEENCSNVHTGVYPYWSDIEGNLVTLPEKIVRAPGTHVQERILTLDLSGEWEERPTEAQLRGRAESYVRENNIGIPTVNLTVSFVPLDQTEEYKHLAILQRVNLCDTVNVEFPKLGVCATAKVVKTVYNVLTDRYESIDLGEARANIVDTIIQQGQSIQSKPSMTWMQTAIMTLTATILGAKGGAVRLLDTNNDGWPDTLYIADNPDPAQAVKVWRFNYEGWGASKNGFNGPFVLGATLEHGILAEAITAAQLIAGHIKSADGKTFFLDLDNGILKMNATEFTVAGKSVDTIVSGAVTAYDTKTLNQEAIFNKLTSNGALKGIYMENGVLYINADYLAAGQINTVNVSLGGKLAVFNGDTLGGHVGFMSGSDGVNDTDGIGVSDATGENYVIATNAGVRMQSGPSRFYGGTNGVWVLDGDFRIKGNLDIEGSITAVNLTQEEAT